MRCLTLADALRERGAHCSFICRNHPGNLFDLIEKRGCHVHILPDARAHMIESKASNKPSPGFHSWLGVDWYVDAQQTVAVLKDTLVDRLIVDHYALDARWENVLRAHCNKLFVIDDLADRSHVCDVLLDQNLGRESKDYDAFVPSNCIRLVGPQNALLRPEFAALREYSLRRRQALVLKHILIAMGGVDQSNASGQVLEALKTCPLPVDCKITVVLGGKAPWVDLVRVIAATMPWPTEVRIDIVNMARVMAESDLAIGAAGTTSWERCCLGLPAILVVLADNQLASAHALQAAGAASLIEKSSEIRELLKPAIRSLMNGDALGRMSRLAANITDGQGTKHVVEFMECLQ